VNPNSDKQQMYGQPTGEHGYAPVYSKEDENVPVFACWMPAVKVVGKKVKFPFPSPGGYKVHLSVALEDAERVAQRVLPILHEMNVPHKVVYSLGRYATMNKGNQRGKFITIFVGPLFYSFLALVKLLDRVLEEMQAAPGPQAMDRTSAHLQAEQRIGNSGLLTYVIVDEYDM
jgi:hypothetical protein